MTYVTDPELIATLNAKAGIGSNQPVTDPALIAELNKKAGIQDDEAQPNKSLSERYMDFMQPKKVDNFGHPMANTFLGRMPDPRFPENRQAMMQAPTQQDMKNAAGVMTMVMAPEVKFGALLPSMIKSRLPQLSGAAKIAADYLGNIGKVGGSAYAGSKMMGGDDKQANTAGVAGAGITAATSPLMMMTSSMNPLVRMLAGTGLGSVAGYGVGQMTGGSPYTTAGGSLIGALLGLRGRGASQLAAQNAAQTLTPEQIAMGRTREAAGREAGVDLTLAEKTGSPVIGAMQQGAAMSSAGSKVLYPFGLQRQAQEEKSYQNFLNKVSPENGGELEEKAFKTAFNNANQQDVKVNVKPVVDYIDNSLPKYEEGSKIAKALNMAKDRLSLTPETASKYQKLMAPVTQMETTLQRNSEALRSQIAQAEQSAPEPYFRASTGYDEKLNQMKAQLSQNESALNQIGQQKQAFLKANNIGEHENTVEGLHNAKMGIRGIMEGQGENAIGKTASGKLKQVNKILNKQLKDASPEYADATQISNLRQARESIEQSMAKSNISGSNFYDKVLTNRNEYEDLYHRLSDPQNPKKITEAQKALSAMREAFPDLMDNLTAKSGKALAEKGAEINVNMKGLATSFLNKIYMDRYNKAVAELMINPNWHDELMNVARMKAGEDRGIRLGRLISKVAVAGGVAANQNNQQGRESYGSQP